MENIILFLLIFLPLFIFVKEIKKEYSEGKILNKIYKKLNNQEQISNNDFLNYLRSVTGKAIWRIVYLSSLLISLILLVFLRAYKKGSIGIILIFLITLITTFFINYQLINYNNFHVICGGRGCNDF